MTTCKCGKPHKPKPDNSLIATVDITGASWLFTGAVGPGGIQYTRQSIGYTISPANSANFNFSTGFETTYKFSITPNQSYIEYMTNSLGEEFKLSIYHANIPLAFVKTVRLISTYHENNGSISLTFQEVT